MYILTCTFVLTQIPKLDIYIYIIFLTDQRLFIKRVQPYLSNLLSVKVNRMFF